MAIIRRPSAFGELAKVLDGVGDEIQKSRDIGVLAQQYEPYFGGDKRAARAAARNPQVASGLMKMKAAEAKQQKRATDTERAANQLEAVKNSLRAKKELGVWDKLGNWAQGTDKEGDQAKTLYEALKKNPIVKELGIALPQSKDDVDTQLAFVDLALEKLGGKMDSEEDQQRREISEDEQEESAAITDSQREQAENELDVQDVAAKAAPELQDAPVDDTENDEFMDQPAMQMQQEMGQPRIGTRIPEGQQAPQGTPLAGLGREIANVAQDVVQGAPAAIGAGLYSGATLPVQAAEAARQYLNPAEQSPEQQQDESSRFEAKQRALGLEPTEADTERNRQYQEAFRGESFLPSRQEMFKNLGGKDASTALGKALVEFAGDAPEQLALGMITGGVGNMAKAIKAAGMVQGAGNLAKFLSLQVGAGEDTANTFKLGASLLTAYNRGPTLKKAADEMYKAAEAEIPTNLRIKNVAPVGEEAFRIRQLVNNQSTGFSGNDSVLNPLIQGNATYKQALDAVSELSTEGNITPALKRSVGVLRDRLMKDMRANREFPQEATKLFSKASEMWKNMKNAQDANDIIGSNYMVRRALTEGGLKGLANLGIIGAFAYPRTRKYAIASAAATGAYGLGRTMQMMATSPAMRQYYGSLMKEAALQNAPGIAREAKKLNAVIEKQNKPQSGKSLKERLRY